MNSRGARARTRIEIGIAGAVAESAGLIANVSTIVLYASRSCLVDDKVASAANDGRLP